MAHHPASFNDVDPSTEMPEGAPQWQDPKKHVVKTAPKPAKSPAADEPIPPMSDELRGYLVSLHFHQASQYECSVCGDEVPFKSLYGLLSCQSRSHVYCVPCWRGHIREKVNGKGDCRITCMNASCRNVFDGDETRLAPADVRDRLEKLLMHKAMSGMAGFVECSNPGGCGFAALLYDVDQANIFNCIVCSWKTCATHRMQWHEGFTCAQYDRWRKQQNGNAERANEAFYAENVKNCPFPDCNAPCTKAGATIEDRKNGVTEECDHMTCARCSKQFCWRCMRQFYGGRNAAIRVDCPLEQCRGRVDLHCHHSAGCGDIQH